MGKLSARTRGNKANLDVPSTHPMEAVYTKIVVRQDNLNLCSCSYATRTIGETSSPSGNFSSPANITPSMLS